MNAPLPLPRRFEADGVLAPLAARELRVSGPFAAEIADAVSDLTERAFGVRVVVHDDAPHILVSAAPPGPSTPGVDPRPAGRAGTDEGYRVHPVDGLLRVETASAEGLFRALVTVAASASEGLPALRIEDRPDRAWRGLSLDVVRRWFDVGEVRRVIDLLALHRLNVLHLHLTDTQAWRFEVPGHPHLTDAECYTGADLAELERYARDRFVVIVPEIDVPGHVPASLATSSAVPVEGEGHPIVAYLDARHDGVRELIAAAFGELALRFSSPYLHFGGDEAFGAPEDAYVRTVQSAVRTIRALGRTPLGWQESIRADALGSGDLVQLWIAERDRFDAERMKPLVAPELHPMVDRAGALFALSVDDPARIGAAGVPAVVSSSDPLYLDRRPSDESTDAAQNESRLRLGNPGYDPTPTTSVLDWTPEAQPDIADAGVEIAGVEAALWCETVQSFDDAAQLLLPRLALVAQRAWGPAPRDAVLEAAAAHGPVWERLGFTNHYRSEELVGS